MPTCGSRRRNRVPTRQLAHSSTVHVVTRTHQPPVYIQLRFRWVKEMAYALRAMHSQNIIHRDVKSANVLLDDQWSTKLCDYGLAVSSTSPSRMLFSGYVVVGVVGRCFNNDARRGLV